MSWIEAIEQEFRECLKLFPELEDKGMKLLVQFSADLKSAKGKDKNGQPLVILFLPPMLRGKPGALRPIMLHELSHWVDRENPDKIFFERADEKSKRFWQKLQEEGMIMCEVVK